MANEEIRGEYQDPRLIGISAPANTMGLGGNAGAMPAQGGIPPIPPPYVGGPQKVWETLPINGRKFHYDFIVAASNGPTAMSNQEGDEQVLTMVFPLLGPAAPYHGTVVSNNGTGPVLGDGNDLIGFPTHGAFTTLITGYSGKAFVAGYPLQPIRQIRQGNPSQGFNVSGTILQEYFFNWADTDGIQPVFIPMSSIDVFSVLWTVDFADRNLPANPTLYEIFLHIILQGVFIPDNGLSKELQVSL